MLQNQEELAPSDPGAIRALCSCLTHIYRIDMKLTCGYRSCAVGLQVAAFCDELHLLA